MPIYTYYCNHCSNKVEVVCKVENRGDYVGTVCEKCKIGEMKRGVDTGSTFVLKGGGWFKDGY